MKLTFSIFFFVTLANEFALGANILGVVPTRSFSHQIVFWPIWKELSLRGHQVTLITTDPINDPNFTNLTEIDVSSVYKPWKEMNMFEVFDKPIWEMFYEGFELERLLYIEILENPEIQKLIQDETKQFDLVMIESFHSSLLAFAPRFKCPLILMTAIEASSLAYAEAGNPSHPVLHPDFMLSYTGNLTFLERLSSWFHNLVVKLFYLNIYIPSQQKIITKYFGEGYPYIRDIFKNYSLMFINSNPIIHANRPLLPNIIQIGGAIHLRKPSPLPGNLQKILDDATNGFIYFSLGSNAKSKHLSNKTKENILNAFKELPYTVLWKFEDDNLSGVPKNVVISKWYAQQDILRHPNVKLFITQCGLQSTEEAIFNNVPLVGIPSMADQWANGGSIVSKGLGLLLDYKNITKNVLKTTILEVINNPSYRTNVIKASQYIKDRPQTALEKAIWWTEFVIRHKGAPHLKNLGLDLPWYQYYLLDILGFLIILILILFYMLRLFFKVCLKVCSYKNNDLKKKEKQT